ncbi:MAG: hypothetical protein JWP97_191 [Labilithrix sp.]|nr:hypothetical protein [Labilithrix sp.]
MQRRRAIGPTLGPMRPSHLLGAAIAAALLAASPAALACGAAYPGGPVMCDYPRRNADGTLVDRPPSGAEASGAPVAHLSASYAFTSTTILFGSGRRADLTRHGVFGALQLPLNRAGTVTGLVSAGGIVGGTLVHGAARDTVGPGFAANVGAAWRV